jgi:hypothetical protein
MRQTARDILIEIYLDWVNNYTSIKRYAECNGLTETRAHALIDLARVVACTKHPEAWT